MDGEWEVFISYQWDEKPRVQILFSRLTDLGFKCWLDIVEMPGGSYLNESIDQGIRHSKVFLSCVTKKYSQSTNCKREVNLADSLRSQLKMIPLKFESMDWPPAGSMSLPYSDTVYIDFTETSTKSVDQYWNPVKFDDLVVRLTNLLRRNPADKTNVVNKAAEVPSVSLPSNSSVKSSSDYGAISKSFIPLAPEIRHAWHINSSNVSGVTHMHGKLYVVCATSKVILVYSARTHETITEIKIPEIKKPNDIAACQKTYCLYIADSANKCVWRVIDGQTTTRITKWIDNIGRPFTLSSTPDGRVVIPSWDSRCIINIYTATPFSTRTSSITLPSEITCLQHAIETPRGNYVICHGFFDSPLHRVCEVDNKGGILRRFGSSRGDADEHLNWPVHLSAGEGGRVYVADFDNDRVVQLSEQLERYPEDVNLDSVNPKFHSPKRLWYIPENGNLVIGFESGDVLLL